MEFRQLQYPYPYLSPAERAGLVPPRSIISIAPAEDGADALYTGNGSHRLDISGQPYGDEITVTQERLYEPKWVQPPEVPDLRPYIAEIRRHVLEGRPELADRLVEQAQREAGHDQRMNLDAAISYPIESLRSHHAFRLRCVREDRGDTGGYLRWLDLLSGKVTTRWETAQGVFTNEYIAAYDGDVAAARFTAPEDDLSLELTLHVPGGRTPFGESLPGSSHRLDITNGEIRLAFAYDPALGRKGYLAVLRLLPENGSVEAMERGVRFRGRRLTLLAKVVRVEADFRFAMVDALAAELAALPGSFAALERGNRAVLGERMERSRIRLGAEGDALLSGEELLRRCHSGELLQPTLLEKLYDLGRFYQIIDTGCIPPMWGQHNINTNLQVCAGNNTGLFDEMDVYFRYYESKLADFRTNAQRLFGARGLLASVHCDPDSGLFYHTSRTYPHYCWTGCLGWIYNEFWGYYLCTGDERFLRERVVPVLKELALFYEDYACERDADGKVIFCPSFSPENPTPNPDFSTVTSRDRHPTRINSVMDIAICREVLTNLIDACRSLGIETELLPHWERQRADLPVYLLDEEGGLKEWAWPTMEENYNHRHVSHHYDVWPGRAVTPETEPALAEAIRISNRKRGQQDDSAHGIIHRALCAIRLKDVEELEQNLGQLLGHGFVRRCLSTAHFPYRGQFPDLQGAMPAMLLEMCVYSAPGVVELLPALPQKLAAGALEGVWLYTFAKLERMDWDAAGVRAELVSDRSQRLTLRIRRPVRSFTVNGAPQTLDGDHCEYEAAAGERLRLEIRF